MPLAFRCYTDPEGRDVIREWYDERDEVIQGEFAGIVEILRETNRGQYNERLLKPLERRVGSKCFGLHELLLDREGDHYRILGFLERHAFVMLYPFNKHIDHLYKFPCEEAQRRKTEVMGDRRRAKDCEFPPYGED
jgi:hypothetical protein